MLALIFSPLLAFAAPLDGVWRQDCAHGYSREEAFSGERATYTERNFWDADCARASVETISRGDVRLGGTVVAPDGARAIDFVFRSVSLRALDARAAELWNARGVCGFRDWRAGQEKDVSGRECDFFGLGSVVRVPAAGTRKFGVVKTGRGVLFFGRLAPGHDGSSPDTRPVELDPAPYRAFFVRKPN